MQRTVAELGDAPLVGSPGRRSPLPPTRWKAVPPATACVPHHDARGPGVPWDALSRRPPAPPAPSSGRRRGGGVRRAALELLAGSLLGAARPTCSATPRTLGAVADLGVLTSASGRGRGSCSPPMRDAGADAVGVDYRIPLRTWPRTASGGRARGAGRRRCPLCSARRGTCCAARP
ncbi:hypothetical protein QJS66_22295 [Kocuria rhizophila]|nr:hypothetical protein QJS66_22295 [Kocuria rhizophila]